MFFIKFTDDSNCITVINMNNLFGYYLSKKMIVFCDTLNIEGAGWSKSFESEDLAKDAMQKIENEILSKSDKNNIVIEI